jgi:hypothetical protein
VIGKLRTASFARTSASTEPNLSDSRHLVA